MYVLYSLLHAEDYWRSCLRDVFISGNDGALLRFARHPFPPPVLFRIESAGIARGQKPADQTVMPTKRVSLASLLCFLLVILVAHWKRSARREKLASTTVFYILHVHRALLQMKLVGSRSSVITANLLRL